MRKVEEDLSLRQGLSPEEVQNFLSCSNLLASVSHLLVLDMVEGRAYVFYVWSNISGCERLLPRHAVWKLALTALVDVVQAEVHDVGKEMELDLLKQYRQVMLITGAILLYHIAYECICQIYILRHQISTLRLQVDRVFATRTSPTDTDEEIQEYLVKWKGLSYSESTWYMPHQSEGNAALGSTVSFLVSVCVLAEVQNWSTAVV